MNNLFTELKRRNLFRVAAVYAVISWLIAQMASLLESAMKMPDWFDTMVVSCLLLGFPIAMILAWAFEMTPEGVKRTEVVAEGDSITAKTGRGLDFVLVGSLLLVGGLIVGDRLMPNDSNNAAAVSTADVNYFEGQSIAVLPFEDFSADKDQAYFADGIAEELLNVLARVKGLRVASRTSAFSFKERESSIAEIAKALNVEHILEGSVRKAGNTLRITAQLIDTKTDEHMWSETYDRPLTAENIFQIQDEISKAIVLELNGRLDLLPESNERLTQSTPALEAYLKGKESYASRDIVDIELGITELVRAVTIDPEFAVAHAKLARAYTLKPSYSNSERRFAYPRAKIHIERAQALAPSDWEVHSEYAWYLEAIRGSTEGQDVTEDQVVAAFDAAIDANSNNAEAHRGKGYTLFRAGQLQAAKLSLERAKELNPKESLIFVSLSGVMKALGDAEAALQMNFEAVRIDPTSLFSLSELASTYRSLGNIEQTHRILQSCRQNSSCAFALGDLFAELGVDFSDPSLIGGFTPLIKFYVAEDFDNFALTVAALNGPSLITKVSIYTFIGRWNEAYKLIQENPQYFESFMQGSSATDSNTLNEELCLLAALERNDDPRAKSIRTSLSKRFQGIALGNQSDPLMYSNGALWHALENNLDTAMLWLDALADLNHSSLLFEHGSFEPLKSRSDYQAYVARMKSYRARDRGLIEAQLANPPEVWWSPDELETK